MSPAWTFVDAPSRVSEALATLETDVVGVDVERADAHRYFRRAALVQVGAAEHCVLLDGVTLDHMGDLDLFLGPDRLAVLHAADNDLVPLLAKRVDPDRIADTAIAAAVLGLPTGLERLLDELLGIQIDGDKSRFQRADWEMRPLPADMAAYAAGDVVHLPQLWHALAGMLISAGRMSWYEQELAAMVARVGVDERDWRRVRGAGRLSPEQRAVLRRVWQARERVAQREDLAPNHLLHDDMLLSVATDPPRTPAQLVRRARRKALVRAHAAELMEAIQQGLTDDPEPARAQRRAFSEQDRSIVDALRRARSDAADDLGIDAGVLLPARTLAAAVAADPVDADALCASAGLKPWQQEVLADVLWDAYVQARDRAVEAS